ncbi:aminoglycoside phosphotransferase family protein [Streptomyces millisiae]|uniref:Aminoglycoside phosphotransferase family protein n=1 Tax=Streptomyces millisiae TaxID=3075542 RepID=A0ABU2LW84_9ACTN|nr:aminoglycoside phosphotransferase family protein [Streptomyces sp. DSM 44918]MDT0321841.1 aminoglycoside phosphotransferase family protein [Streptomyces sp. DSM 44918]
MTTSTPIDVPDEFAAAYGGEDAGRLAWLADLPRLGGELMERWGLRPDGPSAFGMASLVLPVLRNDGTPAVLKLQQLRAETVDIATGLRAWDGDGIVRLLEHDEASSCQLVERLDAARPLSSLPDEREAVRILAELLARLTSVPAPAGIRRLADVAAAMVEQTPSAVPALVDPAERALLRDCAAAVAELVDEAGDRLLHWDLHYDNVLAAEREPWLAIDPEPLAGDPGFDLLPALDNRWAEVVAGGDVARAVRYRFDLLTEVLGLDRRRAVGWTLGRVLQNSLWDVEDGKTALDPVQLAIAEALRR